MRFVYLDHGHYTFDDAKAGGGGELLRLFRERCVFSGRLLRLLFAKNDDGTDTDTALSARVMKRMGPALVALLDDSYREDAGGGGESHSWVAAKLAVVDRQLARLADAVAACAAKHGGVVDVI